MKRILPLCVLWALPVLAAEPPPGTIRLRDLNGDGQVSRSEAETSVVDEVMRQVDTNKDGKISRAEAKALPTDTDEQNKEKMKQLLLDFDKIDTNHDGQITRQELSTYVKDEPGLKSFMDESKGVKPASATKIQDRGDSVTDIGYRFKF